jgi:hypothetical protein
VSFAAAVVADAVDDEPVTSDAKVMLASNGIAEFLQLVAAKLDELVADLAIEVVVLRITIVVLVHGTATKRHLSQQARLYKLI